MYVVHNFAIPSAVFKAMFPENPSVTTTSTIPLVISFPSTNPVNFLQIALL